MVHNAKNCVFIPHCSPTQTWEQATAVESYVQSAFFLTFSSLTLVQPRDVMRNSLNTVLAMTRRAGFGVRECAIR